MPAQRGGFGVFGSSKSRTTIPLQANDLTAAEGVLEVLEPHGE